MARQSYRSRMGGLKRSALHTREKGTGVQFLAKQEMRPARPPGAVFAQFWFVCAEFHDDSAPLCSAKILVGVTV